MLGLDRQKEEEFSAGEIDEFLEVQKEGKLDKSVSLPSVDSVRIFRFLIDRIIEFLKRICYTMYWCVCVLHIVQEALADII